MLRLFINQRTIADGTIELSWCIDGDTLTKIKKFMSRKGLGHEKIMYALKNMFLAIVMYQDAYQYTETRYVVPIKQGIAYLTPKRPGHTKIFAMLVIKDSKNYTQFFTKLFLERYSIVSYLRQIFSCKSGDKKIDPEKITKLDGVDSDYREIFSSPIITEMMDEIEVVVPEEVFANEPPRWLKKWVNMGYDYPSRDQCQFRRRMAMAFTIKPISYSLLLLITLLISCLVFLIKITIASYCLLIGRRGIDFNPLRWGNITNFENISGIAGGTHGSIFLPKVGKTKLWICLLLAPIFSFPLIISLALDYFYVENVLYLFSLGVAVILSILTLSSFVSSKIDYVALRDSERNLEKEKEEKIKLKHSYRLEETINDLNNKMACQAGNPRTYEDTPLSKRPIILIYQHIKSKICRPFQV